MKMPLVRNANPRTSGRSNAGERGSKARRDAAIASFPARSTSAVLGEPSSEASLPAPGHAPGPGALLARTAATDTHTPVQRRESPVVTSTLMRRHGPTGSGTNDTGMPDRLKSGIEALSGVDMSDVRVHYNSSKPARLNALSYAQGSDIHIAPGQDRHLAHEAWHVVQQKAGRVRTTREVNGAAINDDRHLEREADRMGSRALHMGHGAGLGSVAGSHTAAGLGGGSRGSSEVVQRKVGFEFETSIPMMADGKEIIAKNAELYKSKGWHITPDSGKMEFVTEPIEQEGDNPRPDLLAGILGGIDTFLNKLFEASDELSGVDGPPGFLDLPTPARIPLSKIPPGEAGTFEDNPIYAPQNDEIRDQALSTPQATGGVKLENVAKLFELSREICLPITSEYSNEPRGENETTPIGGVDYARDSKILTDADGATEKYLKTIRALAKTNTHVINEGKLGGLVRMIAMYLYAGQAQGKVLDQAKFIFPIMSRMSFTAMYNSLDETTRTYFLPEQIMEATDLSSEDTVYKKGFLDTNDKEAFYTQKAKEKLPDVKMYLQFPQTDGFLTKEKFPSAHEALVDWTVTTSNFEDFKEYVVMGLKRDFENDGAVKPTPAKGPQRLEWLQSIEEGTDKMSSEGETEVTTGMYGSSPAMGKYTTLDPDVSGTENELVLVEMRKLTKSLPPEEWLPVAMALFEMFGVLGPLQELEQRGVTLAQVQDYLAHLNTDVSEPLSIFGLIRQWEDIGKLAEEITNYATSPFFMD